MPFAGTAGAFGVPMFASNDVREHSGCCCWAGALVSVGGRGNRLWDLVAAFLEQFLGVLTIKTPSEAFFLAKLLCFSLPGLRERRENN